MEGWNRHEAERTEVLRGLQEERQVAELTRSKQQEVSDLGYMAAVGGRGRSTRSGVPVSLTSFVQYLSCQPLYPVSFPANFLPLPLAWMMSLFSHITWLSLLLDPQILLLQVDIVSFRQFLCPVFVFPGKTVTRLEQSLSEAMEALTREQEAVRLQQQERETLVRRLGRTDAARSSCTVSI